MFAFSITFKVLAWYLIIRAGDSAPRSRPWVLGALMAFIFGGFDVCTSGRTPLNDAILAAAYLVSALLLMNFYYRIHNLPLSLLVGGASLFILLLVVPYFADVIYDASQHSETYIHP
ncbi:MAG TPA: hypothetical protein VGN23_04465 [Verrucomicrobiae bacterium]|jgi:hypothetical protein